MRVRVCVLFLAAAAPPAAFANGVTLPDVDDVALRPGSVTEVGLEANFGWIAAEDGATWSWVCHATVLEPTSSLTPVYFPGPNATLVTVRSLGVGIEPRYSAYRSVDGCNWIPAGLRLKQAQPFGNGENLRDVNVREFAWDPGSPDHVLATTFTGGDATNGIWESDDSGGTWHKTSLDLADRYFRNALFAVADPLRVYASANWWQPNGAWTYVSDDGGDTWTETAWTFTTGTTLQKDVDFVATSPADPDIAYARTNGGIDHLLLTTNGGLSFEVVFSVDDDIRGVVYDSSGSVVLATPFNGIWRATDGRTFVRLPDTPGCPGPLPCPAARGIAVDARGIFLAGNNYEDAFALGLSTNGGASYLPLFRFDELTGPRPCPADSDVARICAPQWPALAQLLNIATPTPSPTATPPSGDDDGGGGACTCSSAAGSPSAMTACVTALLAAAAAVRRRARRG